MARLLIPLLFLSALPLQAGIEVEKVGDNLKVLIDGKLFTEFRSDASSPCLYPLMSPTGTHLTRQFPFVKGDGKHIIKAGESLTQRYRLVLHQGDLASAKLEERFGAFTK